ncbi:uncharacterized protein SCHCODRAFT_02534119 [Schizophyllum commune H4-8]|nr:uncharacterized protein SCHCODRAFT_02534119 [Schizophyllum commune H4-8]KAI5897150.1 hypothetical protein SCHCODRAFT_02534119 [Schizophyllum commune H4-8]
MAATRETVCAKMGSVPEIPLEDFISYFLPSQKLDAGQLKTVFDKLTQEWHVHQDLPAGDCAKRKSCAAIWASDNAPLSVDDQHRTFWTGYVRAPAELSGSARVDYSDLVAIHGQIIQCCTEVDGSKTLKQMTTLKNNATRSLASHELPLSMPDGVHLLTTDLAEEFDWHDVVVAEEYMYLRDCAESGIWDIDMDVEEPHPTETQQKLENAKRVLWCMHQTLCTDPRRRFAFGITFANTEVRLWHYSHAVVVVSKPFDLDVNAKTLIDVYSRFAFATREELGFDPKIELIRSPTSPSRLEAPHQYRITVRGHRYITVNIISNQSADNGIGRCTRVWAAYREGEDTKKLYAIKDCWLEEGRKTEYDIYQDLMQAIDAYDWERCCHKPMKRKKLADYKGAEPIDPRYGLSKEERKAFFIPIYEGEKVEIAPGVYDNTEKVIGRGYVFPCPSDRLVYSVYEGAVLAGAQGSVLVGVAGNSDTTDYPRQSKGRFLRDIPAREHHRLVMAVGRKLLEVKETKATFSTIKDASYALFILHAMGYLYRDISSGNILQYKGQGVLADIEYVKAATALQTHKQRMGTADFVAVEVVNGEFLTEPSVRKGVLAILTGRFKDSKGDPASQDDEPSSDEDASSEEEEEDAPVALPIDGRQLEWRFREAHDLESIWWLVLWILFRHHAIGVGALPSDYDPVAQLNRYNSMFPHYHFSTAIERVGVLLFERHLVAALQLLLPEWRKAMTARLKEIRILLKEIYDDCQGKPPHPVTWFLVHEMCAAGERIQGSLAPIAEETLDVVAHTDRIPRETLDTVDTQGSHRATRIKRRRQDMQSSADSTESQPKRKKTGAGKASTSQGPRRSVRLNGQQH